MADVLITDEDKIYFQLTSNGEMELILSGPQPYGNVKYADPKNGKYPVDTAKHVKAANSYISMPKNAKKYTPAELAKIKAVIHREAKKFGIDIQERETSSRSGQIKTFSASVARPKITPPDNDATHFYKAGRFLSYFPQVNENGIAFEREKVQPVLERLLATTFDIQHIKPGYQVPDPQKLRNTTCGAILSYKEDEEGIDICVKGEIEVARALGVTPEDLAPHGDYGMFSQECEQNPLDAEWIVVDRNDPTTILSRVDYMEGMAQGFRRSAIGQDGKWHYYLSDGNPVYLSPTPLGFVGVAAVEQPADPSARIYSARILSSLYPGMDDAYPSPDTTVADVTGPVTADENVWAQDFMTNPDLLTPSSVNFVDDDDGTLKDDLFAALWETNDPDSLTKSISKRAFRVKTPDGKFDRQRLIAAYQALCGMRGNTLHGAQIPKPVLSHAMAYIRQGLKETNKIKETSSKNMSDINPTDLAALQAKYDEIKGREGAKDLELSSVKEQLATAKTEAETELAARATRIAELESKVQGFETEKIIAARIAELESIHPFKDADEKSAVCTELSSVSEDRFENIKLRRELAKRDHEHAQKTRELASRINGGGTPYVPEFKPEGAPSIELSQVL